MVIKIHSFLLTVVRGRRKALTFLFALFLGFAAQAGIETDRIQSLINEGKLRQALSLTNNELEKDEASVTFRFLKGLILTRLNELDQARDLFVQLTREHPELPEPYNNLAVIYASQGDFEKAREALKQAISTHPSYATAHENMGDIYAKMASKAYNQALQLDADNTSAKAKLSLINDLFFVPRRATGVTESVAQVEPRQTAEIAAITPAVQAEATGPGPLTVTAAEQSETAVRQNETARVNEERAKAKRAEQERQQKQDSLKAGVSSTIDAWANAWSSKNAEEYITYYGRDFTPPKKLSRAAWEAQRKVRLSKPRYIKIGVSNLEITMLGDDHARVTFRQNYESDTYRDSVNKILLLKMIDGSWLITEEQSR